MIFVIFTAVSSNTRPHNTKCLRANVVLTLQCAVDHLANNTTVTTDKANNFK